MNNVDENPGRYPVFADNVFLKYQTVGRRTERTLVANGLALAPRACDHNMAQPARNVWYPRRFYQSIKSCTESIPLSRKE